MQDAWWRAAAIDRHAKRIHHKLPIMRSRIATLVVAVGAALARARGVEPDEIAEMTRVNAARVFGVER